MSDDWEKFGPTISGSRWFNEDPEVEYQEIAVVREHWPCPNEGCEGEMEFTGRIWPMPDPGYHHKCSACDFTAAIRGAQYPRNAFHSTGRTLEVSEATMLDHDRVSSGYVLEDADVLNSKEKKH